MKEIWLTVPEVMKQTGEAERTVRWKVQTKVYTGRYEEKGRGGFGGQSLKILLSSLPPAAQVAILEDRGVLIARRGDHWEKVSAVKRDEAIRRLEILTAFEAYEKVNCKGRTKARQEFCAIWNEKNPSQKVSERTLKNWERAKREFGRMGLVPDYGKRAEKNQISPEAWDYFRQLYLQQQKRSVADCYRDLLSIAADYEWRIPSLRRVQQMAKEIPNAVIVYQREGPDAFLNTCQSSIKRDWSGVPANTCWMGDHHRLDLFVKNANGRGVTRPWLTAWMDARSWKIVGWQLCWTPSGESILTSFRQGALEPTIGLPQEIYIDNGKDYASKEFAGTGYRTRKSNEGDIKIKTTLETLGVGVTFAIPGNARAKTIERFFGTLSKQFAKRFVTYCGSDNKERPEQLSLILKTGLVPTMEDIRQKLGEYIQLYNKTASQSKERLGLSPDEVFEKYRQTIRTAPKDTLRLCLMRHSQPLKVRMGGIEFMKHQYNNPELIAYRGEKVYIRYDEQNMTQVEIFNLKDEWLMTAELVTALPALNATKEQIAAANAARKRELEIARELGQTGIVENPLSPLDQLAIQATKAAARINNPTRPDVVEMVQIPQVLRKAVGQIANYEKEKNDFQEILQKVTTAKTTETKTVDIMGILTKRRKGY